MGMTTKDQYVHRLGRTARAGKEGSGLLLCAPFEEAGHDLDHDNHHVCMSDWLSEWVSVSLTYCSPVCPCLSVYLYAFASVCLCLQSHSVCFSAHICSTLHSHSLTTPHTPTCTQRNTQTRDNTIAAPYKYNTRLDYSPYNAAKSIHGALRV